ncbi:MAG: hypothetical protein N3A66_08800, partial [Planctomycetota bacterium]|nr:hypothetical protein [Planctomycetota bacterium]
VKSLQTTIGLMDLRPTPTWEILVDGKSASLPAAVKAGQRIAIRDGVTYIGIIPLPATDLGRDQEVLITKDTGPEVQMQGGGKAKPALLVEQYNYRSEQSLAKEKWETDTVDLAYGGFAIELADANEYPDFAAFAKHLAEAKLSTQWDNEKKILQVAWKTGSDTIECGYNPLYSGGPTDQCFPYRRVNGEYPYLPLGMERDSTLAQAGRLGRLEKNGAVLLHEPNTMAYLQTEPISGTFAGHNPLPDPAFWALKTPGEVEITADGRLGMARVVVRPKENRLWIDYAVREPDQSRPDMASALLVTGLKADPAISLNGAPLAGRPATLTVAGKSAIVIPLIKKAAANLAERYARAQQAFKAVVIDKAGAPDNLIQDWWLAGPFMAEGGKNYETAFEPEKILAADGAVDTARVFKVGDKTIAWQRSRKEGEPRFGSQIVDLKGRFQPSDNVCAYAYTIIESDADRDALLLTGSDDTITVWLNGQKVLDVSCKKAVMDGAFATADGLFVAMDGQPTRVCRRQDFALPGA